MTHGADGILAAGGDVEVLAARLNGGLGKQAIPLIAERLHHLHEANPRILKVAQRPFEKIRLRHMVDVEYGDEFPVGFFQRGVEVAGLEVFVAVSRQIFDQKLFGQLFEAI